ncbi:hypothetical protein BU16DRAFT_531716 [Lophium mytilinum]|uniref:C2H2-type domain-containing protein n=1 Tax=Lophium mytilinum TaxID=390894 RepID=A0A6A6QCL9_9PEZI|nr:hypothetical protein BU16DRAFT_531716 [Lophium mytilinum]
MCSSKPRSPGLAYLGLIDASGPTMAFSAHCAATVANASTSTIATVAELAPAIIDVEWSGPQKCHWQGCASKATFHSPSALKAHIRNMHVTPLLCTHPGCSYKKAFGKACDLKRHAASIHGTESEYPCPERDCKELFSRKDKMMKHAKEKHQLFKCSHNHCSTTVFAAQRESHMEDCHGRYECAMGSCKSGQMSYFTEKNLKRHLRTGHRMESEQVFYALDYSRPKYSNFEEDKALYVGVGWPSPLRDCASCFSQSHNEH